MLTRIWLLWRKVIQRLNRLIWLRRSRSLTKLTERQLKQMWKSESLIAELPTMQTANLLRQERAKAPLYLLESKLELQTMEDLQTASRQLTSMLTSSKC